MYVEMIYSKFLQHAYMTMAGVMSVREQEWIVISYSVLKNIMDVYGQELLDTAVKCFTGLALRRFGVVPLFLWRLQLYSTQLNSLAFANTCTMFLLSSH